MGLSFSHWKMSEAKSNRERSKRMFFRERGQCKYVQSSILMLAPPTPTTWARLGTTICSSKRTKGKKRCVPFIRRNARIDRQRWTRRRKKRRTTTVRTFEMRVSTYTFSLSYSDWPSRKEERRERGKEKRETHKRQLAFGWHAACLCVLFSKFEKRKKNRKCITYFFKTVSETERKEMNNNNYSKSNEGRRKRNDHHFFTCKNRTSKERERERERERKSNCQRQARIFDFSIFLWK